MKFAVILSGCGQHDGSETHEVITTLLSIEQEGIEWYGFAPDRPQSRVINHITNEEEPQESRSILKESARLVRGRIKPLNEINMNEFDAIVFPGGFGAATNWCNWLTHGTDFSIEEDIRELVSQARTHHKPLGFICIAPVMIPKLCPDATLTIGNDEQIAEKIEEMGGTHVTCSAENIVIDQEHKIVTTPANMLAQNLVELHQGIHKLIKALATLAKT
jgi:enhancing lycopene biosynthesis protein 2